MQRELRKDTVADAATEQPQEVDVLVIGGGFAGCYLLHYLRKAKFNVKVVEAGTGLGGIWYWNRYPGARVDSQYPIYQLSIPEVYSTWTWSEQYPGSAELREYFKHMDKVLGLSKDVFFNTTVLGAEFDRDENKWTVNCQNGKVFKAQFVIASVGFAAKRYIPDFPGLDTFEGEIHHSSFWQDGVDVRGKKAAVIGTGATGVQIIQEWAKEADELTVFQRTPNMAMPMRQAKLTPEEQLRDRPKLAEWLKSRLTTDGGFLYGSRKDLSMLEHSAEEREKLFQELWDMGGFRFIANNFADLMTNEEANAHAYEFWARKQRARINDKRVADILVPLEAPHAFGGKRPSLEQDYYDLFNRPNVHIIDVKKNGIKEVQPKGIVTEDGKLHEFDIIALATGFDSITGGLKDIKFRGDKSRESPTLAESWDKGAWTYLGMSVHGFPNMLFTYGPQAPTAFSNGPSCVEPQADWMVDLLVSLRKSGAARIEATREAEKKWKQEVIQFSQMTLRHNVPGWYNGANIPGKVREPLNYAGGLVRYQKVIREVLENDLEGFVVTVPKEGVHAEHIIEEHETLWRKLTGWLSWFG